MSGYETTDKVYNTSKVKIKCTLVQVLRLCTGCKAHSGSRGIALPFLDHGTRRGEWSASRPGWSLLPVPIVQEAEWAPGPVCTSAENLVPTGIRSPDRQSRSQSLRYMGRYNNSNIDINIIDRNIQD